MKKANHCTGCTEKSWDGEEGRTHQMGTIEHPEVQEKFRCEKHNRPALSFNQVSANMDYCVCGLKLEVQENCDCDCHNEFINDLKPLTYKDGKLEVESWEKEFEDKFAGSTGYCNPTYSKLIKDFIRNLLQEEADKWENSIKFYMQEAVQNRDKEIVEWAEKMKIEINDPQFGWIEFVNYINLKILLMK